MIRSLSASCNIQFQDFHFEYELLIDNLGAAIQISSGTISKKCPDTTHIAKYIKWLNI